MVAGHLHSICGTLLRIGLHLDLSQWFLAGLLPPSAVKLPVLGSGPYGVLLCLLAVPLYHIVLFSLLGCGCWGGSKLDPR